MRLLFYVPFRQFMHGFEVVLHMHSGFIAFSHLTILIKDDFIRVCDFNVAARNIHSAFVPASLDLQVRILNADLRLDSANVQVILARFVNGVIFQIEAAAGIANLLAQ